MALVAIPTFLIARTMVSTRAAAVAALASLCTTAFFYAGFLLPESLAYPTFMVCAWVTIRALAGGGRRWIVAAIVLDLAATEVRGELIVLPGAFALAAAVLWVVGPRGQRMRRGWSKSDYAGATVLLLGAAIVLNKLISDVSHEWATVTQLWRGRLWSLGMQAASALAIGLALLPFVGGLASLWIPERRRDPAWRAFAAFTGAAIVTVWTYTAVKAAYLSTVFATRIEERNLIYLGPLLIVGTIVWLLSRRPWLPGALAALAFTAWLVLHYGYQLDYPYFEAPGYGVATLANRAWNWDQPTIRLGLTVACLVVLAVVLVAWAPVVPPRWKRIALVVAGALTLTWMLAGQITSSRGAAVQSKTYARNLPAAPRLDRPGHRPGGHDLHRPGHLVGTGARDQPARVLEPLGEEHLVARRLGPRPRAGSHARPGRPLRDADERPGPPVRRRHRPGESRRPDRRDSAGTDAATHRAPPVAPP